MEKKGKSPRYRPASTYLSKDPAKRERQLSNIGRGRSKITKELTSESERAPAISPMDAIYKRDIVRYLEEQFYIIETKKQIRIEDWQVEEILKPLFAVDPETGLRKFTLALIGLPKKNGKSTIAAGIANFFLFQGEQFGEILFCANSREQSSWIIFSKLKRSIELNALQSACCVIKEDTIENTKTGTIARVVGLNYRSASGLNPTLTIFDELWGFEETDSQRARKFYAEMTTSPARKEPLNLIVTYAGYDEDSLLKELYDAGLKSEDERMFFYWSHENRASWVTQEYLDTQRKRLRANNYLRMHENRWVSGESDFIPIDWWDACVYEKHKPIESNKEIVIWCGLDASVKRDTTACVSITRTDADVLLVDHKIWTPGPDSPIDFGEVESYILNLAERFTLAGCFYDPYQFASSAQRLKAKNISVFEIAQTVAWLTKMGQMLYTLIKEKRLIVYPDAEIRAQVSHARAKETSRGFRIVKTKDIEKFDFVIALALSCLGAIAIDPVSEVIVTGNVVDDYAEGMLEDVEEQVYY